MKPLILFDIDKTLFDTSTFLNEHVYPTWEEFLDTDTESLRETLKEYSSTLAKHTDFDPQALCAFIAEAYEVEANTLEHLFFQPVVFQRSVFSDVVPTLLTLKKDYRLGTFTEAVIPWQQQKLKLSRLETYFDPEFIFISRRKTEAAFLKALPAAFIIDDNPEVIEEVAAFDHLQPIWLNRKDNARHHDIATIHSLTQLAEPLTQLTLSPQS